jgi:uncharacterized membrane protein
VKRRTQAIIWVLVGVAILVALIAVPLVTVNTSVHFPDEPDHKISRWWIVVWTLVPVFALIGLVTTLRILVTTLRMIWGLSRNQISN